MCLSGPSGKGIFWVSRNSMLRKDVGWRSQEIFECSPRSSCFSGQITVITSHVGNEWRQCFSLGGKTNQRAVPKRWDHKVTQDHPKTTLTLQDPNGLGYSHKYVGTLDRFFGVFGSPGSCQFHWVHSKSWRSIKGPPIFFTLTNLGQAKYRFKKWNVTMMWCVCVCVCWDLAHNKRHFCAPRTSGRILETNLFQRNPSVA